MAVSTMEIVQQTEDSPAEESSAEESEASNDAAEEVEPAEVNGGWADSIAKVLSTTKPKTKKTLVLSRAKKVKPEPVKRKSDKEEFGFEVAESTVQEEEKEPKVETKAVKKEKEEKPAKLKNLKLPLRLRPTWKDIEKERALRKVATKGVVQLFNAVRIQQKELQQNLEEAGPLDSRRDAVLNNIDKRKFLDVLMSGNRAKSEQVDGVVKKEEEDTSSSSSEDEEDDDDDNTTRRKKKKWSVLEDDFLTNKKAKHWDEEDNDDEAELPSSGDESEND